MEEVQPAFPKVLLMKAFPMPHPSVTGQAPQGLWKASTQLLREQIMLEQCLSMPLLDTGNSGFSVPPLQRALPRRSR